MLPDITENITRIDDLNHFAKRVAENFRQCTIFLHGDLGTGKTTFVQLLLRNLGYSGIVTSPSYGIINQYDTDTASVLHADLYRVVEANELLYLDVDEWAELADIICIEWPNRGGDLLPQADLELTFLLTSQRRTLKICANNASMRTVFKS